VIRRPTGKNQLHGMGWRIPVTCLFKNFIDFLCKEKMKVLKIPLPPTMEFNTEFLCTEEGYKLERICCAKNALKSLKSSPKVSNFCPMPINWGSSAPEIRLQTYCTDDINPILYMNNQHCKMIESAAPYLDTFLSYALLKLMYPTTPVSTPGEPTIC
jgi:hypothetical protein